MFLFLLNVNLIFAEDFGYNLLESGSGLSPTTNFSALNVTSADVWRTDLGNLTTANATEFTGFLNQLNIDLSWLENHGNGFWCALIGCTMQGDIDMNNNNITNVDTILTDFLGTEEGRVLIANIKELTGVDELQFNITFDDGCEEGRVTWNTEDGTLQYGMPGGEVCLQIGQEMLVRAKNDEGITINNCQAVWVSGALGSNILVQTPIASNVSEAPLTFGLATETITSPDLGFVTTFGFVRDCDTSDWGAGDVLYLSPFEEGNLTNVRPTAPNTSVVIGIVVRSNNENGTIAVHPIVQQRLSFLSDVYPIGLTDASIFRYNSTSQRFEVSTSYTTDEVDELVGGSFDLYFKNTTAGISTYFVMNETPDTSPKNASSITLSADSTELNGFISPNASDLGISGLEAGIVDSHFHANVDLIVGKKDVEGYFQLLIRNESGQEVLLATSHLVEVDTTTETEYEAHAQLLEDFSLNESDRIVMKLFANLSGSGGNPTLTTYIQGDTLARAEFGALGVNFLTTQTAEKTYYRLDGGNNLTANVNGQGNNLTNWNRLFIENGASIGYNATCQMIFYNSTGGIISAIGCT